MQIECLLLDFLGAVAICGCILISPQASSPRPTRAQRSVNALVYRCQATRNDVSNWETQTPIIIGTGTMQCARRCTVDRRQIHVRVLVHRNDETLSQELG
jgi:hypothetical protein